MAEGKTRRTQNSQQQQGGWCLRGTEAQAQREEISLVLEYTVHGNGLEVLL